MNRDCESKVCDAKILYEIDIPTDEHRLESSAGIKEGSARQKAGRFRLIPATDYTDFTDYVAYPFFPLIRAYWLYSFP
jgi:hypothetical protein